MPYPQDRLFIHKSQWDYLANFELGICFYWMGDYHTAKFHCGKVKSCIDVPQYILDQNEKNLNFCLKKIG
jgi:hypothetical protein